MDISSNYNMTSYLDQLTENTKSADRTSKVQSGLSNLSSTSTKEELEEAAKTFEAYFVEQTFKAMQKMVPEDEDGTSSDYMDYFGDTLIQEYAKSATEQGDGFGIAKMLYEQMKRNYGLDTSIESGDDVKETLNSSNKSFENKS